MDQNQLNETLEKHQLWLDNEEGGECADLSNVNIKGANLVGTNLRLADFREADLRGADLRGADFMDADFREADLRGADLRGADFRDADLRDADFREADLMRANIMYANLRGANLDFSSWPLWCGSLKAKVDNRIVRQLLYHVLSVAKSSDGIDDDLINNLFTEGLIEQANLFHRASECGKIRRY